MRALIRELIETVILALMIFVGFQFSVQNFRVEGPSMEPTLREGQHLLVNKLVYLRLNPRALTSLLPFIDDARDESVFPFHEPRRGEVMIFRFPRDPSRDFVKRVIGVPGDEVEIRQGQVIVNGEKLDEPYLTNRGNSVRATVTVPAKHYYVLGDNRRSSLDSRAWGPVPAENIIGRGWLRYWPLDGARLLQSFALP